MIDGPKAIVNIALCLLSLKATKSAEQNSLSTTSENLPL